MESVKTFNTVYDMYMCQISHFSFLAKFGKSSCTIVHVHGPIFEQHLKNAILIGISSNYKN